MTARLPDYPQELTLLMPSGQQRLGSIACLADVLKTYHLVRPVCSCQETCRQVPDGLGMRCQRPVHLEACWSWRGGFCNALPVLPSRRARTCQAWLYSGNTGHWHVGGVKAHGLSFNCSFRHWSWGCGFGIEKMFCSFQVASAMSHPRTLMEECFLAMKRVVGKSGMLKACRSATPATQPCDHVSNQAKAVFALVRLEVGE